MQVGKRLFPYPVINNDKHISSYKNSIFGFEYIQPATSENNMYKFKDVYYYLENDNVQKLIDNKDASVVCLIECPETLYRKRFFITKEKQDIAIKSTDLNGKISISAFVYSNVEIDNFEDYDFLEEYQDYKFKIEKNYILAIDDGYVFKLEHPDKEDNKMSSIFLVVPELDSSDEMVKFELTDNKIYIKMSKQSFDIYDNIKDNDFYKNIFFSSLTVPALTYALNEVKGQDVDDLCLEKSWFNSICKQYRNVFKEELTQQKFEKINPVELAQALMNTPISKSINDLYDMAMMPAGGGNDE